LYFSQPNHHDFSSLPFSLRILIFLQRMSKRPKH
jgi:hypothetical protein